MASVRRVLAVTAGLAAAGFIVGAMLGAIVDLALLAVSGFSLWHVDSAMTIVGAAAIGGALGMILGPIAAWILMRHVPIGKALWQTAVGTAFGAFLGFLPWAAMGIVIPVAPLTLALVGFAAAALRLRVTHRKTDVAAILPPED